MTEKNLRPHSVVVRRWVGGRLCTAVHELQVGLGVVVDSNQTPAFYKWSIDLAGSGLGQQRLVIYVPYLQKGEETIKAALSAEGGPALAFLNQTGMEENIAVPVRIGDEIFLATCRSQAITFRFE